jgi:hypothetical protein
MQFPKSLLVHVLGGAIAGASLLLSASPGQAAEEVVFRYGILRQRLSVVELTKFAETGEMSPVVSRYLKRTNSDPANIRQILTQPIDVDHNTLKVALNNPLADLMMDELGKMIQTPDDRGNQEALRAALDTSTAVDNKVTVLEVIQNYPADEIHLDVKRAIKTYNRLSKLQKPLQEALGQLGPLRQILKNQGINIPDFLK